MIKHVNVRRGFFLILMILGLALLLWQAASPAFSNDHHASVINISEEINSINSKYLSRSIKKATKNDAELFILTLNTPGGRLDSTRDMVESILGAEIPTVVYVSPPGSHAASAGTFITASANFAVMAPGTNIGSASPVTSSGDDIPKTLEKKINQDVRAFIRSIADARGRNPKALEATVTESRSYSATEAVRLNVVDLVAPTIDDMLIQLHGQTVETAKGPVTLATEDIEVREIGRTWLEYFLRFLSNPNIALLFLSIGFVGVLIEMFTPGIIGPGVVGAIFSGLAIAGISQLPTSWVGIGFIIFGVLLLVMETQFHESDYNIVGIVGVVAFLVGLFLIFGGIFSTPGIPEPGSKASWWLIGTVSIMIILPVALFLRLVRPTGLITTYVSNSSNHDSNQRGTAISDLAPSGMVLLNGTEWNATTDLSHPIQKGEEVQVIGIYGNTLKVSKSLDDGNVPKRKKHTIGGIFKRSSH